MPIDGSIPLMVRPFKGPDFARAYQEAQSLRDIAQQRQLRSVQIASAQGNLADEQTERERKAALTAIASKHRKQSEDGTPTVDYPALIDELNQSGFLTEARQLQLDQANVEILISTQHKRQRDEQMEALTDFKKDLQDVAATGNEQKYAIVKAKAIKLGMDASSDGTQPTVAPKMFREPGGKQWLDSMIERVNIRTMSDKERTDAQDAKKGKKIDEIYQGGNKKLVMQRLDGTTYLEDVGKAEAAPKGPGDLSLAEKTANQWLELNKGKTLVDYEKWQNTERARIAKENRVDPEQVIQYNQDGKPQIGILNKRTHEIEPLKISGGGSAEAPTSQRSMTERNSALRIFNKLVELGSYKDGKQFWDEQKTEAADRGFDIGDVPAPATVKPVAPPAAETSALDIVKGAPKVVADAVRKAISALPLKGGSPEEAAAQAERKTISPATAALPKPAKGADTATDATYDAYFAVYKDHNKTIQAMEAAGWR